MAQRYLQHLSSRVTNQPTSFENRTPPPPPPPPPPSSASWWIGWSTYPSRILLSYVDDLALVVTGQGRAISNNCEEWVHHVMATCRKLSETHIWGPIADMGGHWPWPFIIHTHTLSHHFTYPYRHPQVTVSPTCWKSTVTANDDVPTIQDSNPNFSI